MVDVLKQFGGSGSTSRVYSYGQVVSIGSAGALKIKTQSGLELSIRDTNRDYAVGDQLVLGTKDGNLNSVFIIRKIDRAVRSAVNVVIPTNQG